MSDAIVIQATPRTDLGKGASRRLRRNEGLMPGIVYGGKKGPVSITLIHKDFLKACQNEALFSSVLELEIDGKTTPVILKDLQRHPAKELLIHADFLRVDKNTALHVHVPLHFINEDTCHGVKMEGGRIQHSMVEIEVACLPADLPEYIEVDMAAVELGQIIHISDLVLGKGVESVALSHGEDHDLPVATVAVTKGGSDEDEEATDEAAPEADAAE